MQARKPDFWLILLIFVLVGFGLVMVFSTSYYKGILDYQDAYYYFYRQLLYAGIGILVFFVFANIPYHMYRKHIGKILLLSVLLLVLVLLFADYTNGAKRWLSFGSLSFQPSEFVKLAMIIYTASIMIKKQDVLDQFQRSLLPPLTVIALMSGLLVVQPHYSATIILITSCMIVIFCAGARVRHLLILVLTTIPLLGLVLFMDEYRIDRLMTLFDPFNDPLGNGYQIIYSLYAIGPGGLLGAGLGNSIQKLSYLPEAHTDFIFSIVAEELGFIGASFLILLFIALVFHGIRISLQSPDLFGTLLGIGITSLIGIEAVFNLGVVTGILPVTGVPLPFISYGGSALVIKLLSVGILVNISRYRKVKVNKPKQLQTLPS